MRQRLQVIDDGLNAGLRGVRAVAVAAAAVGWRSRRSRRRSRLRCTSCWFRAGVGVFDFIDDARVGSSGSDHHVLRRSGGLAILAEPHGVARAQHDVVGAGSTHHCLVIVVTHGVGVGKIGEVRRVTLLHVVEAHRG